MNLIECKHCIDCSTRNKELLETMDRLLNNCNVSFKDGQRTALIEAKRILNAILEVAIQALDKKDEQNK